MATTINSNDKCDLMNFGKKWKCNILNKGANVLKQFSYYVVSCLYVVELGVSKKKVKRVQNGYQT